MDKPIISFDEETPKPLTQRIQEAEGMRDYFLWKSQNAILMTEVKYFKAIADGWQKDANKYRIELAQEQVDWFTYQSQKMIPESERLEYERKAEQWQTYIDTINKSI